MQPTTPPFLADGGFACDTASAYLLPSSSNQLQQVSPLSPSDTEIAAAETHPHHSRLPPGVAEDEYANAWSPQSDYTRALDNLWTVIPNTISPPTRETRKQKAPKLHANDWEAVKARIIELYTNDNLPLVVVMDIMRKESGFTATMRQYKSRLSHWGVNKNIKLHEMKAIVQKRQCRKVVETDKGMLKFRVRGNPVDPEKIERWMERNGIQDDQIYSPGSVIDTPTVLQAYTASEGSSPAPSPAMFSDVQLLEPNHKSRSDQDPCIDNNRLQDLGLVHNRQLENGFKSTLQPSLATSFSPVPGGSGHLPRSMINIPFRRNPHFIDREVLMKEIHERHAVLGTQTALVGIGGVGKSELAIESAYRIRARSAQTWIFWVHASSATRFEQSFQDIADCVGIPGRQKLTANVFKLVHDWLRDSMEQWMLILDNADDASFLLDTRTDEPGVTPRPLWTYVPQSQNGTTLITSRSMQAALDLVELCDIITVSPMCQAEAMILFTRKVGSLDDSDAIEELTGVLEYIPLAIVQAAAYIAQRKPRYSVQRYLSEFRTGDLQKMSLLSHEGGRLRRDVALGNSIIATWQTSFNHILQKRHSAASLLSTMSFFDRVAIPEDVLRSPLNDGFGAQNFIDPSTDYFTANYEFETDVLTLRNFAFIYANADGVTFDMHSLVQLATKHWLQIQGTLEVYKEQFIKKLNREFPAGKYEDWSKCQALFHHVLSALSQRPQRESALNDWAFLMYKGASYAWNRGHRVEAEKMANEAMIVRKKVLGLEHRDTLESMALVGSVYEMRGMWQEAQQLAMQVLETRKMKLGADDLDTLTSMANLASIYRNVDRWDDAEELDSYVMDTRKTKLGVDHPDTLTSMANLASTYRNIDRWDEAEELDLYVMGTRKTKLGVDHPDTLTSMANLAATYSALGREDKAEPLKVYVMETRQMKLGMDHPSTLSSMANLAFTLYSQGRKKAAVKLMGECVELGMRKLGPDHPDTFSSKQALDKWQLEIDDTPSIY